MRELALDEIELVSGGYQGGTDGPSLDDPYSTSGHSFTNDRIGRSVAGNSSPASSEGVPQMSGYTGGGWILTALGTGLALGPVGAPVVAVAVGAGVGLIVAQGIADYQRYF